MKMVISNVFQCTICQGIVDRYEHVFKCRNCGALGDLMTGIMTQMSISEPSEETP